MLVSERCEEGHTTLTVALVNNMPDAAFVDTEDQFRHALTAGAAGEQVDLRLYAIAEVPRAEATAALIQERYGTLEELLEDPPDALIVTGTEPVQATLPYEPYWNSLTRLLEWASESVPTTLLSCLAAHASVLLFDGIERRPLPAKVSGVYAGIVHTPDDPLVSGLPELIRVPHSRVNQIPAPALLQAGYRILVDCLGDPGGWSVASRMCGESLFVLFQGHPEYSTLSLLREYRRDIRRHLFGRGLQPFPRLPDGYLSAEAEERLSAFARSAADPRVDSRDLWTAFPYEEIAAGATNSWASAAAGLYGNWLAEASLRRPLHSEPLV